MALDTNEDMEFENSQTQNTLVDKTISVSASTNTVSLEKGQMMLTQTAFVRPLSKAGPGYVTPVKKQDHVIPSQEPVLRRNGTWVEMYDPISDRTYFHNEATKEYRSTLASNGAGTSTSDSELSDKKMTPNEKKILKNSGFESCDGSGRDSD